METRLNCLGGKRVLETPAPEQYLELGKALGFQSAHLLAGKGEMIPGACDVGLPYPRPSGGGRVIPRAQGSDTHWVQMAAGASDHPALS